MRMPFRYIRPISCPCDTNDCDEDQPNEKKQRTCVHMLITFSCTGVSHLHCVLAEAQRQVGGQESFTVAQSEAFCALIEAVGQGKL